MPRIIRSIFRRTSERLDLFYIDLDGLVVDYRRAYGRGIELVHDLGDFVRVCDAGRFPALLDQR